MFKNLLLAAAMVFSFVSVGSAATINGQIDISGTINLPSSNFSATGNVDFNNPGLLINASGSFSGLSVGSFVALTDIDFTAPGTIWTAGIFSFVASSFSEFQNTTTKAFKAVGLISAAGYDDTFGVMTFSAQKNFPATKVSFSSTAVAPVPLPAGGLLLLSALGGIAAVRRRRKANVAA